jgi:hypothetical protein
MDGYRVVGVIVGAIALGYGLQGIFKRSSDRDWWARMVRMRESPGLVIGGIALILISLFL